MHLRSWLLRSGLVIATAVAMVQGAVAKEPDEVLSSKHAFPQLLFEDEFNHLSLIPSEGAKWRSNYHWGPDTTINNEMQYYVDVARHGTDGPAGAINPFHVNGGILAIEARPAPPDIRQRIRNLHYTSGSLTTEGTFAVQYGYFEIRAKLPTGRGLWPAFWIEPADREWPPEIDVFEVIGQRPWELVTTVHSKARGRHEMVQHHTNVGDMSKDFHVYAVDWTADSIVWYFDGREIARAPTPPDLHKPCYMLLNLAVGGNWPGAPDMTTGFPAWLEVDWVRVWSHRPW
jgi:beta-glucanase (GH16 family)